MFSVTTVGGNAGLNNAQIQNVRDVTLAAANFWGQYLNLGNVTLEIEIDFEDLGNSVLANAGPVLFFDGRVNGNDVFEAGTLREVVTGVDPNGSNRADILVTVNSRAVTDGTFFFGDFSNGNLPPVPRNQIDFFATLLHELGHGFGFLSFLDRNNNNRSNFDLQVQQNGSAFSFIGANAQAIFGGPVPLTNVDPSHLSTSITSILGPRITFGERLLPNRLDVAIFQDLGFPVFSPTNSGESFFGFDDNDSIALLGGNDRFSALGGNDIVSGGTGNDTIDGGAGNDRLFGDGNNDLIIGGTGRDTINGGAGFDTLQGNSGNDIINGGANPDHISGDNGNDTLSGGAAFDRILGGDGDDVINGNTEGDFVFGQEGNDTVLGGDGSDRVFGNDGDDVLRGGNGNDRVHGGTGRDLIDGGSGNDFLHGRGGFDTITGGGGDDRLIGGFNADTFVFANGFGRDRIDDFEADNNAERIDLSAVSAITSYQDLITSHLSTDGNGNAVITAGADSITLLGVSVTQLDAIDFVF